jgi:hypothetical protein
MPDFVEWDRRGVDGADGVVQPFQGVPCRRIVRLRIHSVTNTSRFPCAKLGAALPPPRFLRVIP